MKHQICSALLSIAFIPIAAAQTKTDDSSERSARAIAEQAVSLAASSTGTEDVVRLQMSGMLSGFKKSGISEQAIAAISPEVDQIVRRVSQSWNRQEAARIYSAALGKRLTASELENAERYFQSNEGKKVFEAVLASQSLMQMYIGTQVREAMKIEVGQMIPKVLSADMKTRKDTLNDE